jgi:hypothetical protein
MTRHVAGRRQWADLVLRERGFVRTRLFTPLLPERNAGVLKLHVREMMIYANRGKAVDVVDEVRDAVTRHALLPSGRHLSEIVLKHEVTPMPAALHT